MTKTKALHVPKFPKRKLYGRKKQAQRTTVLYSVYLRPGVIYKVFERYTRPDSPQLLVWVEVQTAGGPKRFLNSFGNTSTILIPFPRKVMKFKRKAMKVDPYPPREKLRGFNS